MNNQNNIKKEIKELGFLIIQPNSNKKYEQHIEDGILDLREISTFHFVVLFKNKYYALCNWMDSSFEMIAVSPRDKERILYSPYKNKELFHGYMDDFDIVKGFKKWSIELKGKI